MEEKQLSTPIEWTQTKTILQSVYANGVELATSASNNEIVIGFALDAPTFSEEKDGKCGMETVPLIRVFMNPEAAETLQDLLNDAMATINKNKSTKKSKKSKI